MNILVASIIVIFLGSMGAVQPVRGATQLASPAVCRADIDGDGVEEIIYGTGAGCIHVLKKTGEAYQNIWTSELLKAPIVALLVDDFDGDYEQEIIVGTADGSIYIFGCATWQLEWDNRMEAFGSLNGLLLGDFDDDGKKELIAYHSEQIYVIEEGSYFLEWSSDKGVGGECLAVGNIDRQPGVELITNSGYIIDPEFYRIKWEYEDSFGQRIWLLDIDNDGMMELFGEKSGGELTVYDLDVKSARIR